MRKLSMVAVAGVVSFLVFFTTSAYAQETVTLTVNSAYGAPDPAVGVHTYAEGTVVAASVGTPVSGGAGVRYACVGWKAKGDPEHLAPVGYTNLVTFTITNNIVLTWKWKAQYLLTVIVEPVSWAGHIEAWSEDQVAPEDGYWDYKRVAQLQAVEHEGYDFLYWSGGSLAVRMDPAANPTAQQMRRPEIVTAVFTPEPRYFTVCSEQGEPAPMVGTHTYYYDHTVDANCGPNPYPAGEGMQYVYTGYEGTGDLWPGGSETSISFIIHHDSSVTWLWKTQYYLTVDSAHGDPQGTGWYDAGTSVTCSMSTPEVYAIVWGTFTEGFEAGMNGWTTGGTFNWFLVTEDKHSGSYSARSGGIGSNHSTYIERSFTIGAGGGQVSFWRKVSSRPYYHTLKFYIDGSLYESISGVVGWAQSVFSLAAGTRTLRWEYTKDFRSAQNLDRGWIDDISVTNTPVTDYNTKYVCTGYSGTGNVTDGSQTSVSFVITLSSSITWTWKTQYKLTTTVSPADSGSVARLPDATWYDPGAVVQLTAVPNVWWLFTDWSGDLSAITNPQNLTMDSQKSVTANFAACVPVADFAGTPTSGNVPLTVVFTDVSTGNITSWAWNFGAGASPATANTQGPHSIKYNTEGLKTVSLTLTGPGGSDTHTKVDYIDVLPPAPVARFTASPTSGRVSLTVQFTDISTGIVTSREWDFDNDGIPDSTIPNPSHTYNNLGTYTVKLTVSGPGGTDEEIKTNYIAVLPPIYGWTRRIGGSSYDSGYAVCTDGSGNLYAAGSFSSSVNFAQDWGATEMKTAVGICQEIFVTKIDAGGEYVWSHKIGEYNHERAFAVCADGSGNVYVAGEFMSSSANFAQDWGGSDTKSPSGCCNAFVTKIDPSGNYCWTHLMGSGQSIAYAVCADGNGNVYVAGVFNSAANFAEDWGGTDTKVHAGCFDVFITKIDASGNYCWTRRMGDSGWDYGEGVCTDGSGNVYVAGYFEGSVNFAQDWGGSDIKVSAGEEDIFITKIDASGNYCWTHRMGGWYDDEGCAVCTDGADNVYVAGKFWAGGIWSPVNFAQDWGRTDWKMRGGCFVTKIDSSGGYCWTRQMGGPGTCYGWAVCTDGSGSVYVAGEFWDTVDFAQDWGGSDIKVSAGGEDIFTTKIDASGNYCWTCWLGGSYSDRAFGACADSSGNVYVTGYFEGTVNFRQEWCDSDIKVSAGNNDIFITKLEQ